MKHESPQKDLHRNSVQNGPVDNFTALTVTIFVSISVLVSQDDFGHWPNRMNQRTGKPHKPNRTCEPNRPRKPNRIKKRTGMDRGHPALSSILNFTIHACTILQTFR